MYTMVDGAFVARLIGTDALSAVNIVFPAVSVYMSVGIMLGTGGSAVVARQLGEGDGNTARRNFSLFMVAAGVAGLLIAAVGLVFVGPIVRALGADARVFELCRDYAWMLMWFVPMAVVQAVLQSFFVAAGRPGFGLAVVLLGGVANIVLDYVFIALLGMGMAGAALATGIGYSLPTLIGLWFFAGRRGGSIWLTRPRLDGKILLEACVNGSSEMVTNLSMAVITYLFNVIMMKHLGVEGVAAITIVLYAEYLLVAIFFGYSSGVAPLFSYQYGKGSADKLKKLFRNSLVLTGVFSLASMLISLVFASDLVGVFAPRGSEVFDYALHGFKMFSPCFLFMGFNIFASALFTALSNGKISALLSFLRTFVFIVAAIALLPRFIGVDGVWLAVPAAELLSLAVSAYYLGKYRAVYRFA